MYENMDSSHQVPGFSVKRVFQEIKDLKFRLTRIEDEVAALHELLRGTNGPNEQGENFHVSPLRHVDFADSTEEPVLRSKQLPRREYSKYDNKAVSVALMMNNQAWYGDAFLFEIICQIKGHQPKEHNWYNSVVPFSTIRRFSNFILSQKWFHHTCVLSVGYSEIFKFIPITDKAVKRLLHNMLNHMREHGAKRIKVLSLPPARQMMKNIEYLRLCQTNNRILQSVTETHVGVDFINLDSFFLKNSDESFNYFENDVVCIEILDNLLMKKEDDKFFIYINPELAKCLMDYVSNYSDSSTDAPYINRRLKGCEFRDNNYEVNDVDLPFEESRFPRKRRYDNTTYSERHENSSYGDDLRAALSIKRANHRNRSPPMKDFRNKSPTDFPPSYSPSRPEPSRRNSSSSLEIIENNSRHERHNYPCPVNTNDSPVEWYYSYPTNSSKTRDGDRHEEQEPDPVGESREESASPPPWIRNSNLFASTSSRLKEWSCP